METEIIYFIVTVVCFIIIGYYQRHYIKALKGQVNTQKDILDSQNKAIENLKMHVDIYQPDKIQEFVKMEETTYKNKMDMEIAKIKSEMEIKSKNIANSTKQPLNEFISAIKFILRLSYFVHPNIRQSILEEIPDNETLKNVFKDIKDVPYYEFEILDRISKKKSSDK